LKVRYEVAEELQELLLVIAEDLQVAEELQELQELLLLLPHAARQTAIASHHR
jgi:hypothetical protein